MRKLLVAAAFAALLVLPALASSASAEDVVQEGRTIEAFLGTNLVNVQGYPANKQVDIEVVRNGVVVGSVSGTTNGDGFVEFNHAGGGQVSNGGDCFKPPATPDIMGGDVIRTTTEGDPPDVVDSAVVRDLSVNFEAIDVNTTDNTITVSGSINSRDDASIDPGQDVLELRLNKGSADRWDTGPGLDQDRAGRKDLRVDIGGNVQPDGSWTRTLQVSQNDAADWQQNPGEVSLEWSAAAPAGEEEEVSPPAIFVADEAGGEAILGCPPLAEYAITDSSHSFVNEFNVDQDMTIGGVAFDADEVSVSVPGGAEHAATLTPATPDGQQTWTATVPAAELGALPQGEFEASARFSGAGAPTQPDTLKILKDTEGPAKPTATPEADRYNRAQKVTLASEARTTVHYTVNGSRPTTDSRSFSGPIPVTATQTIKAIAVDGAGNTSGVARFRYVIRARSFVALNLRHDKVKLGHRQLIRGRVFPNHAGDRVKLIIRKPGKNVVRNLRLRNNSTYRFVYKPNRVGRYFVKVRFRGDKDHGPSVRTKSFRVIKRR